MTVVVEGQAEVELWRRAVAGDAQAFGDLFELHARAIYNFCFRRTANWAEAEDAMSEVFLVAWKRRAQVEFTSEGERVLPWLLGVSVNVLRNSAALESTRDGGAGADGPPPFGSGL